MSRNQVTHISSIRDAVKLVLNRKVHVVPYYDLRTPLAEKCKDAENREGWTAFINKKGSLAHVVRNGCDFLMIRITGLHLHRASDDYMNKIMSQKLYEGLS